MTATIKINIKDINSQWIEELKEKYPDQNMEIKIIPSSKTELLDENTFWDIINLLDWTKIEDDAILAPAIEQLASFPVHYIYLFQDVLSEKLFQLDAKKYALHIGEDAWKEGQYFSVDHFLYARCCVVANGKDVFEKVIEKPETMPKDITFEALLNIASKAYELKTGEEFNYMPQYNYETYSNQKGWDNQTTPQRLKYRTKYGCT